MSCLSLLCEDYGEDDDDEDEEDYVKPDSDCSSSAPGEGLHANIVSADMYTVSHSSILHHCH